LLCNSYCGLFRCPFSLAYIVVSYGYCWSYCSYGTKVEKEEEVTATQEHKKPASKRNLRNSKSRRREPKKKLMFSTLNNKK
jgi:hypothetical protein